MRGMLRCQLILLKFIHFWQTRNDSFPSPYPSWFMSRIDTPIAECCLLDFGDDFWGFGKRNKRYGRHCPVIGRAGANRAGHCAPLGQFRFWSICPKTETGFAALRSGQPGRGYWRLQSLQRKGTRRCGMQNRLKSISTRVGGRNLPFPHFWRV